MINYLRKWGLGEYVLWLFGFGAILKLFINFWNDELIFNIGNGAVILLAVLFMFAPRYVVAEFKKKLGNISTKK